MARQISELEIVLEQLIAEHGKLLKHLEIHQAAMKAMDLRAMAEAAKAQEACRSRIIALEVRRRAVSAQAALVLRLPQTAKLGQIATAAGPAGTRLLDQRRRLREMTQQVSARATVVGRLAAALLGHINTMVRIMAGAVEHAGLYTRDGVPRVTSRIGVMEAVG